MAMTIEKSAITSRSDGFTESVIRDMTRLALQHSAVNLAQGFPDFPAPDELKAAACEAINSDHNQYAITWGAKELRQAISQRIGEFNGMNFDPETEITVTCGSTEAMIATMLALVNPGEEVVVPEPFYENYGPDTEISGAVPRFVPLEADLSIDEEKLKAAFGKKTKAIVINTPNNPTGKVFSRTELELIRDLCVEHDVIALTDEIYEHIVYDGHRHVSLGSLEGMRDRTVTINSLSKTYSVTGWRVGYALADRRLAGAIRKIHDFLTVGAPAPLQHAAITALRLPESYYAELARTYDHKRRLLYDGLQKAGFKCELPQGAYYIWTDISDFGKPDVEFARYLATEIGVAAVPGSSFYRTGGHDRLRFTFSKKEETLLEACQRLEKLH